MKRRVAKTLTVGLLSAAIGATTLTAHAQQGAPVAPTVSAPAGIPAHPAPTAPSQQAFVPRAGAAIAATKNPRVDHLKPLDQSADGHLNGIAITDVPATVPSQGLSFSTAVGLGALVGVVGFNLMALGPGALPGGFAYAAGATVPAEMSVAMSRVFATASAVAGGLIADHLYSKTSATDRAAMEEASWVDPRLLAVGAGAIGGIATFNLLTVPLGTVPLAGGTLATVPTEVALGSRFLAALSGGIGALAGAYTHSAITGEHHDKGHMLAMAGGAMAGVAVGNVLSGWGGGLPLSSAFTSQAALSDSFASAAGQAASRIYVITAGVLGAWAGDALYSAK